MATSLGTNLYAPTLASDPTAGISLTDERGLAMEAKSALAGALPPTTAGLYAKGCRYVDTSQTSGISPVYVNAGTEASPSWSAGSVQKSVVTLSSAQILALNATPVALVAAPGSGLTTVVERIVVSFTVGTQYANGGVLEFRYTNASGAKVTGADLAAAVITGASSSVTILGGNSSANVTAVSNAAIVVDNATAPFITGTGTAVVTVFYSIV